MQPGCNEKESGPYRKQRRDRHRPRLVPVAYSSPSLSRLTRHRHRPPRPLRPAQLRRPVPGGNVAPLAAARRVDAFGHFQPDVAARGGEARPECLTFALDRQGLDAVAVGLEAVAAGVQLAGFLGDPAQDDFALAIAEAPDAPRELLLQAVFERRQGLHGQGPAGEMRRPAGKGRAGCGLAEKTAGQRGQGGAQADQQEIAGEHARPPVPRSIRYRPCTMSRPAARKTLMPAASWVQAGKGSRPLSR